MQELNFYDAVALAGTKSVPSSNLNFFCSSRRSSNKFMQAWSSCDPTERYQTSLMSNPGVRERSNAGKAKRTRREAELSNGGTVLPSPWNMLELVKTIPAATKLNATRRR